MKKELQLRGISRTPSDRMSADGGCAESLNVQIEENEVAAMIAPDNITDDYFTSGSFAGRLLYMHKGRTYNNIIYLDEANHTVMAIARIVSEATTPMPLFTMKEDEVVLSVNSVGNTLIVSTNQRMEYVLHKEGVYRDLGDTVPVPMVEFTSLAPTDTSDYDTGLAYLPKQGDSDTLQTDDLILFDLAPWQNYLDGKDMGGEQAEKALASYNYVKEQVWNTIAKQIKAVKQRGLMCTPVFARYALRLYDGSYIYQSVPVLLGAGEDAFVDVAGSSGLVAVFLNQIYEAKAQLVRFDKEGWEDIVDSIDIFLSTDIHNPKMNSDIVGVVDRGSSYRGMTHEGAGTIVGLSLDTKEGDASIQKHIREEMLSKRTFYLDASFSINDLSEIEAGYNLLSDKNYVSQDYLATQPTLPDDYQSFHRKIADNLFKYNERLMLTGITQEVSPGYMFLNGQTDALTTASSGDEGGGTGDDETSGEENPDGDGDGGEGGEGDNASGLLGAPADEAVSEEESVQEEAATDAVPSYELRYYIRTSAKEVTVVGRYADGSTLFVPSTDTVRPLAWLAYPDSRCFRVDVKVTRGEEVTLRRYAMEPHPGLNSAFTFIGLENEFGLAGGEELAAEEWEAGEDRTYKENNVVWASEMGNPFYFPVTGRLSFYSEVIALANATKALSEGQFGQYPLYVFTGDGIWSVPISSTGDFAASVPMSRDVALSSEGVQAVEQAIVFVTAQGVMLLQGSSVTNLSSGMMGEHYKSAADVLALLRRSELLKDYAGAYGDDTPFQDYVAGCRIAYDYTNARLLFYRSDMDYQYVYRFGSQSWHKMSLIGQGMRVDSHLNSYPDCYLSVRMSGAASICRLYDLSVEYEPSKNQTTLPGLVITRPFDLDAPDVRKAITDIRIRGYFNRRDVRYILVGSMDGRNWGVLPTLRGGSYKLFRLVLMIGLEPTERLSWVDVTYETRLSNRLR